MQYVVAELFRGHELRVEQITGSFSVLNETAFSMAESLMTMVIRPQDSDTALTFNLLALLVVDFFVRGAQDFLDPRLRLAMIFYFGVEILHV